MFFLVIFAQDPPSGYYQCYGCKGAVKSDPCWDGNNLNNVNVEKCLIGCFIQTRIGTENENKFDEIERGCVENGPKPDQQGEYSGCAKNHTTVSCQKLFEIQCLKPYR